MVKLPTIIYYFLFFIYEINSEPTSVVNITNGSLQGKFLLSESGRRFRAFLGIPFASPPTGVLRFMPPEPPQDWEGVRSAMEEDKACVQMNRQGDEDCLYLNVFSGETTNESRLLPVMVYIHGGGFYRGSASADECGPEYFMNEDIVLVTIQYRLGVFGFLSNEDSVIPGNQGLKDQQMALHWVQKNIKFFGGDPSKVTIFGNSAGSASVHLHMISPTSKDLFARAISQSGTALSGFAFIGRGTSKKLTNLLAHNLNCSTNSSLDILLCLQNKSASAIQQEYSKLQLGGYKIKKVLYRPVVEVESPHAFLIKNPLNTTSDKPWLVGIAQNEGLWKINVPLLNETKLLIHSEYKKFFPSILFFDDTCSNPDKVAEQIYDFYFRNTTGENETIVSLEQVITDSYFFWPTFYALAQHKGPTYCYLFAHLGEHSVTEIFQAPQGFGVSHMDELIYLFPHKNVFPGGMNSEDKNISKLLVDLWVNFATEGNPTPRPISKNPQELADEKIIWEESENSDLKFLKIQTNTLSIEKNVFQQRMDFWKQLPIRDQVFVTQLPGSGLR